MVMFACGLQRVMLFLSRLFHSTGREYTSSALRIFCSSGLAIRIPTDGYVVLLTVLIS